MSEITTPRESALVTEIFNEIKAFENLQIRYRDYGARDTEPDGVFQGLLWRAILGEGPAIPRTGSRWELYASSMRCEEPAKAMHDQALKIVQLIESCPIRDIALLKSRLERYCWRCN